jgi:DNA-binding CsgD family transcriptional regulator
MIDLDKTTLSDIKNGYYLDEKDSSFICIHCGRSFNTDEVFKIGDKFFGAATAVRMHIQTEHKNKLNELIDSENKYLSLTDNQKALLILFGSGLSDNEIAKQLNVTPSTVRHQKFIFREKAKSAKIYLAVWDMAASGLYKIKNTDGNELLPLHGGAKMVDERYVITEEENKKILEGVFESLEPLKLKVFSAKEKKKIVILRKIAEQFEKNRQYSEKEVNGILSDIFEDYVTLRRYLIEYGYMERTRDCKTYWLI